MTESGVVVSLRWAGGRIELPDGQYLIGRSSSCDVVIDEARVSRRHAQLEVDGTDVHVLDLESRNGVYVNERPVRRVQALAEGDVILIGAAELTVDIVSREATAAVRRPPKAYVAVNPTPEPEMPLDTDSDEDGRGVSITQTFDDLELIGRVADRALSAGHPRQAEAMVESHLRRVLDDILRSREVSEATVSRALDLALRLAQATHRGQWFDYAIDLLRARRVVCSERLLDRLGRARQAVDRIDPQRIKKYIDTLRADGPTMDELRAAQRLQGFLTASVPPT